MRSSGERVIRCATGQTRTTVHPCGSAHAAQEGLRREHQIVLSIVQRRVARSNICLADIPTAVPLARGSTSKLQNL
jgi:hypothetical protein